MESLKELIPWSFALHHPHYSRWLPVHLRDMIQLNQIHPNIAAEFRKGKFVVNKTSHAFSSIAIDQAHEQHNAIVKGEGGAIGLTQNMSQLTGWMVGGPEEARVINEFEEATIHVEQSDNFRHHEQVRSIQATFVKEVNSLTKTIEDFGNPFADKSEDLLVLDTKHIVGEAIVKTVKEMGKKQFDEYFEKRLVQKTEPIDKPIKRNSLALFDCPTKPKKSSDQQLVISLQKQCSLFSRLYISCQVRDQDLDEFFRHENEAYPPSLSKIGELRSGTKSDILPCLEKCLLQHSKVDTPDVDNIVIDGPAIVHILKPIGAEYAEKVFIPYVTSQKSSRIEVIWDEYKADSLKCFAGEKRGKGTRRRVEANTKIPSNWKEFLKIDANKAEFFALVAHRLAATQSEKVIITTVGKSVLTNDPNLDTSSIEP